MTREELIKLFKCDCKDGCDRVDDDKWDAYAIADFILSERRLLLEKIGKLTNAISAIQMLIEEDIEERKGFTFNRKKMLDIAEEALK